MLLLALWGLLLVRLEQTIEEKVFKMERNEEHWRELTKDHLKGSRESRNNSTHNRM